MQGLIAKLRDNNAQQGYLMRNLYIKSERLWVQVARATANDFIQEDNSQNKLCKLGQKLSLKIGNKRSFFYIATFSNIATTN